MNKEEILAKSREENKDKDLVSVKADSKAAGIAIIAAAVYATIYTSFSFSRETASILSCSP